MAHRTTVIQTCCNDVSKSRSGFAWVGVNATSATPTMIAKITTCNISPSTMEPRGFPGKRLIKASGISSRLGGESGVAGLTDCAACVLNSSAKPCPGSNRPAIQSPMTTAIAVVHTKNRTTTIPSRRSCSTFSLEANPRIIEAKTSGMTIIWTAARNKVPGSANQFPINKPI